MLFLVFIEKSRSLRRDTSIEAILSKRNVSSGIVGVLRGQRPRPSLYMMRRRLEELKKPLRWTKNLANVSS